MPTRKKREDPTRRKLAFTREAMASFRRNGFHATSVNNVVSGGSVCKATLYRYYRSKDDLIAAVLELERLELEDRLNEVIAASSGKPGHQVQAIFGAIAAWIEGQGFTSPLSRRAADEFHGRNPHLERFALSYSEWLEGVFLDLGRTAGLRSPDLSARHLALLLYGAVQISLARRDVAAFSAAAAEAAEIFAL